MSNAAFNKIISKLNRLDEYLGYLKDIQKVNRKSFVSDYHFFGLAERYLQLSIEAVLDIGKLLIIFKNTRRPEDNQEIFLVLGKNKIISNKLAGELRGIAGFRNILVHDYEKIDREIVYQKLHDNFKDFNNFKREILKFLRKN